MITLVLVLFMVSKPSAQIVPESQEQIQLSFAPVVKQVAPAVVNIYTKRTITRRARSPFMNDPFFSPFFRDDFFGGRMRQQVESSLGSGLIISEDGLVVTNEHVIRGAEEITIGLSDGREFDAKLALSDDASDLALLRADHKGEALPYAELKPSESLEVGDLVLAIGNPFGVGQTVTSGIVSAQGRSTLNINDFNFFIQTDAAINPGNSGGPLVTLDGKVVGINTAIFSRTGGSLGIGFAVPSEMVATVIAAEKMGRTGEQGVVRPWLGVTAQAVTADIADSLDLDRPAGVLIAEIHAASPLRQAGIKVGDVVLRMDGKPIRDPSEMKFRMATIPIGESTNVVIARAGTEKTYRVKAIVPPDDPPRQETKLSGPHQLNGAVIANINPAVAVELGITEEEGVVVLRLTQGTRARRVLRVGDVLVEINGVKIQSVQDAQRALQKLSQGLSLVIKSRGQLKQIIVR